MMQFPSFLLCFFVYWLDLIDLFSFVLFSFVSFPFVLLCFALFFCVSFFVFVFWQLLSDSFSKLIHGPYLSYPSLVLQYSKPERKPKPLNQPPPTQIPDPNPVPSKLNPSLHLTLNLTLILTCCSTSGPVGFLWANHAQGAWPPYSCSRLISSSPLVLPCPCLALSCLVLSDLILSCLVLPCLV